jgi:putative restriction endonuclease
MATWLEDTIEAMTDLGGICRYSDLYAKVLEKRQSLPPTWKAIIRQVVESHSSDSDNFNGKNIFYSAEGLGNGVWGLVNFTATINTVDLTEDDIEFPEGKEMLKAHIFRERNPKLVIEAKKRFKLKHNTLFCEVCNFTFADKYGTIGEDFIEVHHTKPISEMGENEKTNINDVAMVCSNCHRMLHRRRPWLELKELRILLIS